MQELSIKHSEFAEEARVFSIDLKKIRNDMTQFQKNLSTDIYDQLKDIQSLKEIDFLLEKERSKFADVITHFKSEFENRLQTQKEEFEDNLLLLKNKLEAVKLEFEDEQSEIMARVEQQIQKNASLEDIQNQIQEVRNNLKGTAFMFQSYIKTCIERKMTKIYVSGPPALETIRHEAWLWFYTYGPFLSAKGFLIALGVMNQAAVDPEYALREHSSNCLSSLIFFLNKHLDKTEESYMQHATKLFKIGDPLNSELDFMHDIWPDSMFGS